VTNTDVDELIHAVEDNADAIFTWDYEKGARPPAQQALREGQALAVERRDRPAVGHRGRPRAGARSCCGHAPSGEPSPDRRRRHAVREVGRQGVAATSASSPDNWTLSQFMHGEQGALICTAKIVETVPWIDAKYYAATQVMDEARHVEVFAKYLDTKLDGLLPDQHPPRMLLDDIVNDSRWDMTYLGMQIMVEGLALAAFGLCMHDHDRAAAQAAAPLRDERRGPPRRLRCALAEGVLRGAQRRRDVRAPGVRLRGRRAHARPLPSAGGLGPHGV
jgi:hypothetical protein